jgi:hypothetical protein
MRPVPHGLLSVLLLGLSSASASVSLPPDFPELHFDVTGSPSPGRYFFCPNVPTSGMENVYMVIAEASGEVVYYQRTDGGFFSIEEQSNGMLAYSIRDQYSEDHFWVLMDTTYTPVDTFTVQGYPTDVHGMHVADNGNLLLIGTEGRYMDLSKVIYGGHPRAFVIGLIVQEQTMDHEVVFTWSSFDHIPVTDAATYVDLTAQQVDYTHCNSIYEDSDGNIVLSCLAMCACIKIDRTSGDVIWRLGGGYAKSSTFALEGDPLGGFNAQHDFRPSGADRYTVFDNGTHHDPRRSRALEYELDLEDSTATLVWSYEIPDMWGSHMGSVQRLPDGHYVVGWGDVTSTSPKMPDITEVDGEGDVHFSGHFEPTYLESYKVNKYDWIGQAEVPYLCTNIGADSTSAVLTYNVFGEKQYDHYNIYLSPGTPGDWSLYMTTPQKQVTVWALPQGPVWFAVTAVDSLGVETGFSNADSLYVSWTGVEGPSSAEGLSVRPLSSPSSSPAVVVTTGGPAQLRVLLYDISGRLAASEWLEAPARGRHTVRFDRHGLPSGVYPCVVRETEGRPAVTRLVVVR